MWLIVPIIVCMLYSESFFLVNAMMPVRSSRVDSSTRWSTGDCWRASRRRALHSGRLGHRARRGAGALGLVLLSNGNLLTQRRQAATSAVNDCEMVSQYIEASSKERYLRLMTVCLSSVSIPAMISSPGLSFFALGLRIRGSSSPSSTASNSMMLVT